MSTIHDRCLLREKVCTSGAKGPCLLAVGFWILKLLSYAVISWERTGWMGYRCVPTTSSYIKENLAVQNWKRQSAVRQWACTNPLWICRTDSFTTTGTCVSRPLMNINGFQDWKLACHPGMQVDMPCTFLYIIDCHCDVLFLWCKLGENIGVIVQTVTKPILCLKHWSLGQLRERSHHESAELGAHVRRRLAGRPRSLAVSVCYVTTHIVTISAGRPRSLAVSMCCVMTCIVTLSAPFWQASFEESFHTQSW